MFSILRCGVFFALGLACFSQPVLADGELQKLKDETVAMLEQGQLENAESAATRALAIVEKATPVDSMELASCLHNLAAVLTQKTEFAKAEPLYKKALAIREENLGADHLDVANTASMLARLHGEQGRFDLALPLQLRALAIREKRQGAESPLVAVLHVDIGQTYYDLAKYADSKIHWERSLAINEKLFGKEHKEVATNLNNLGTLYDVTGQPKLAEQYFLRALAMREKLFAPDSMDLAATLNGLGTFYYRKSEYEKSESAFLRATAIAEKNLGPDHPIVAILIGNLASMYEEQGRVDEAIALHLRELDIGEKTLGPEHPDVATTLNNLGITYLGKQDLEKAEPMFRRALAISEKILGPEHPDVANALNNVAAIYMKTKRYEEALPLQERALAIHTKSFGAKHPMVATTLRTLAGVHASLNRFDSAEALIDQAIEIQRAVYGENHPELVATYSTKAGFYFQAKRYQASLEMMRTATDILRRRFSDDSAAVMVEQKAQRSTFLKHLEALSYVAGDDDLPEELVAEGFTIAQLSRASSVGRSVAQMSARFAQGSDELSTLVRKQQDTRDALSRTEKSLFSTLLQPTDKRDLVAEAALQKNMEATRADLRQQEKILSQRFPEYGALVSPAPIDLKQLQALLSESEAVVAYAVGEKRSFAWVIRRDGADFESLDISARDIEQQVKFLRNKLQPNDRGELPEMTPATSSRLYRQIFAPLESSLTGVKRIFLIPDAALQSLPFGILGAGDAAAPEWLATRYAFATLPSVSALRALRHFSKPVFGKEPFIGFGDPVLDGESGNQRGLSAGKLFVTRGLDSKAATVSGTGVVDVAVLRKASPLPDTAEELKSLSRSLKGSSDAIYLQAKATETRVKQMDLRQYRFVGFSTHGVMAGEMAGVAEPGLILTPPENGTLQDDGYLSASEVAQLKLNADWVLLSACNTAAPDGTPGAEGLSGLAKAFFYAGTRSLLVSNWQVSSEATQKLMSDTMKLYVGASGPGKPEALQGAMLSMMNSKEYRHPFFWAAFVVVGD